MLSALCLLMLVRMLMSFISPLSDSTFAQFLMAVTEPVIYPMRALADRFGWFESLPLDMPFMITYILLVVIQMALPTVTL